MGQLIHSIWDLGEIKTFKLELAVQISIRFGFCRKDVDSLQIGDKANVLALLAFVGMSNLFGHGFGSMVYNSLFTFYF
jgi:hypothetical protein